jgi:hypothetical protein
LEVLRDINCKRVIVGHQVLSVPCHVILQDRRIQAESRVNVEIGFIHKEFRCFIWGWRISWKGNSIELIIPGKGTDPQFVCHVNGLIERHRSFWQGYRQIKEDAESLVFGDRSDEIETTIEKKRRKTRLILVHTALLELETIPVSSMRNFVPLKARRQIIAGGMNATMCR